MGRLINGSVGRWLSAWNFQALIGLVLYFGLAFPAFAQFTTTIEGRVSDQSDASVPGAEVRVENVATGVTRTVKTSSEGYYRVTALPPGTFTLRVTAQGFDTLVQENIILQGDQTKTINTQLKLGTSTTQVNVTSEVPLVETGEAKISGYIQEKQISELPLTGRNFMTLVVLTPGVTGLPSGGGQAYAQATGDIFSAEYGVNMNANGQRAESNNFQVDGASVNGSPRGGVSNFSPSADAVQELRVSVNNFSAEYGRNSSASVSVVTKSGTNEFHGTMGWYHTNNQLQARNTFQPKVPVFRRNEWNGTLGGPIIKNKLFAFGSVDFLRSGLGQGFSSSAITPQFAQYIQSNFGSNISSRLVKDYPDQLQKTGDGLFAGPLAGAVKSVGDCAGLPGGAGAMIDTPAGRMPCNFPLTFTGTFAQTLPRDGTQWFFRIDYNPTSRDRIYGSAGRTDLTQTAFGAPQVYPKFTTIATEYTAYWNVNYTHTFSPSVLTEAAYSGTRAWGTDPVNDGFIPLINVPGIASYNLGFSDATFIQNNMEWRSVTSINRGAHAFKFGGIYQCNSGCYGAGALFSRVWERPYYNFNNLFDFVRDDPFSQTNIGFNPKTGEALGYDFRPRFQNFGLFIQDDWKAKKNLTISAGLRWETYLIPTDADNLFTRAVFPSGNDFTSRISNMRTQYTYNYFFGIQYSLFNSWALEGNFTGSQGRKIYNQYDVNRYPGDLFDGVLNRLNPSFGAISYGQANTTSGYNGANFSVRHRYAMGLTFQAAYTFGKAVDYASSFSGGGFVDVFNLRLNRGLADFDIRNKIAITALYDLPQFGSGVVRAVLGGWQIGGNAIMQSGRPFSVYCSLPFLPVRNASGAIIGNNGCDYNADGNNNDFPNTPAFGIYNTGTDRSKFLTGLFSASDFPAPAPGRPGTLGRNTYFGPGFANTDMNVVKRFPLKMIGDKGEGQFRAEFFNLFNRVNLGQPTGNLSSSLFGKSTSAFGARNEQFGLKIIF
jgi:outer membrane receptor protein involved in Fe transport